MSDFHLTTIPARRKRTHPSIYCSTRGMGRISSGIDVLLSERISEREKILQNFRQYWQQQQEKNIWPSLLTIIHNATTAALADESLE